MLLDLNDLGLTFTTAQLKVTEKLSGVDVLNSQA